MSIESLGGNDLHNRESELKKKTCIKKFVLVKDR